MYCGCGRAASVNAAVHASFMPTPTIDASSAMNRRGNRISLLLVCVQSQKIITDYCKQEQFAQMFTCICVR